MSNKNVKIHHEAKRTIARYDLGVSDMFRGIAATGSCNIFIGSGKQKSVDEDALVLRTMTGAPGMSLGLIGSTTES